MIAGTSCIDVEPSTRIVPELSRRRFSGHPGTDIAAARFQRMPDRPSERRRKLWWRQMPRKPHSLGRRYDAAERNLKV
jgi:hypothetical protein